MKTSDLKAGTLITVRRKAYITLGKGELNKASVWEVSKVIDNDLIMFKGKKTVWRMCGNSFLYSMRNETRYDIINIEPRFELPGFPLTEIN